MKPLVSVVLPAYSENQETLEAIVAAIKRVCGSAGARNEIIIVDDGSVPALPRIVDARIIRHPYNMGNGAAIKTGTRAAEGEILVFMDADGQHNPEDVPRLLAKLEEGYDMVIGARTADSQAGAHRAIANVAYSRFASWMTGHRIEDLTSGFRAVRADKFRRFLYLLPNGFSYPTTSTMAFFRSAFPVAYVPIKAGRRKGASKIRMLKDGTRFFLIILKIGALFSPMRLFLPVSFVLFMTGALYYSYTYLTSGRFTNMSALLFIASLLTFLIGIVSEQVSALHYRGTDTGDHDRIDTQ